MLWNLYLLGVRFFEDSDTVSNIVKWPGVDDQSVYLLGGDVPGQPCFLEVGHGAAVQDVGNRVHHRFSG